MKNTNFDLYSGYYDLLYEDKDYDAEVSYIDKCIKKYKPHANSILELGSGTGKHGLIFQSKGYEIHGLERSEKMVQLARTGGFSCEQGDIINYNIGRSFDITIALFHVISYITDNKDLLKTFSNVRRNLTDNGLFIFDVWYTPAVYLLKPENRIKEIENDEISVIRFANPLHHYNLNVVDVNYKILVETKTNGQYTVFNEVHPMRHFSIPEIKLLAEFSGFEFLKAEEFVTGNDPSPVTWGVNFILRKNG